MTQASASGQAGGPPTGPQSSGLLGESGEACNGGACCNIAGVCGPPGQFWASAEYLLWWTKGSPVPPLVTTGPQTSPTPGALGDAGTRVLFGGGNLDRQPFSGGRFTAGFWLNDCHTVGVEADYFFLGSRSDNFTASTTGLPGSPVLARPFFDVTTGTQNSELIGFPGLAAGSVAVHSTSSLQGAEANLLCNLCCSCANPCDCCGPVGGYRVDLIGGFRYLGLREGLGITESLQVSPGSPALAGENIRAFDQFDTRNDFYGGQVGVRAQVWRDRWFANVTGKVALGITHQSVGISGFTTLTPPVAGLGGAGDLLALPSNIGSHSRDVFTVIPEVGLNVGYQVTDNFALFVGYTFLYWSDVVRPGDAIDLRVNSTRTPASLVPPTGPAAPQFVFRGTDFWAQGVSIGAQFRF